MTSDDPHDQHDSPSSDEQADATQPKRESRRMTIVVGLSVALVLIVAAWYVGGRQDFNQIGVGGVNLSLLPKIGEPAPDFTTTVIDYQGRPIARLSLSDLRGRPVWINFWGSWCPPCRAEMPEIQAAYEEELKAKGLVWLAISLDEPAEDAAEFAALNGATFLIASDPVRADTGTGYPIANFPTHILIDEEGIVRDIVLAAIDKEEIIQEAQQILPDGAES
jgi:cytochrome c biogenesis protein CcmG/thiol:disulfide interchange protein DsbE